MITEAIILAGGLGTRLREAVPDLPKCMAPILAKPFIGYLVDYLQQQGIKNYIFSLGYKSAIVKQYLQSQYGHLSITFNVENEPLGTGGAVKLACKYADEENVFVLNGDSYFNISLNRLALFHRSNKAHCSLSLKPMNDFERYGVVELNDDDSIKSFKEKKYYQHGLINGGVYALQKDIFLNDELPEKFSFEKDYLEKFTGTRSFFGISYDDYFIDIGIPADFERAQTELILNTTFNA